MYNIDMEQYTPKFPPLKYCREYLTKEQKYLRNRENLKQSNDPPWVLLNYCRTYFILDTRSNAVKIGRTELPPQQRLLEIQAGNPNPLQLVGVIDGDKELKLHVKFHGFRIRGEWFRYEGELKLYIENKAYLLEFPPAEPTESKNLKLRQQQRRKLKNQE